MGSQTVSNAVDSHIQLLEPCNLDAYNRHLLSSSQPEEVPSLFLDAMKVREAVFVQEQGVPLQSEFDEDDARSCHWILYDPFPTDSPQDPPGAAAKPAPICTIRLVPYPHPPHPLPGGVYEAVEGELLLRGPIGPGGQILLPPPPEQGSASNSSSPHHTDEPYIKLGRLALLKDFRGRKLGLVLVRAALGWIRENPSYFDKNQPDDAPKFAGLVRIHAQESVVRLWEKAGFEVDNSAGRWWEEGIPHVGMSLCIENLARE